jgi:HSP20 family protein
MYACEGSMTTELKKNESQTESGNDVEQLFDEMGRRFYEAFGIRPWGSLWTVESGPQRPVLRPARTDVTDSGTSYRVVAEIPGIPKENLEIHVKGSSVEIRGEKKTDRSVKDGEQVVHRELSQLGYYRALELPEPVLAADAKAKVENGVLELELPKLHPTPAETDVKVPVQ